MGILAQVSGFWHFWLRYGRLKVLPPQAAPQPPQAAAQPPQAVAQPPQAVALTTPGPWPGHPRPGRSRAAAEPGVDNHTIHRSIYMYCELLLVRGGGGPPPPFKTFEFELVVETTVSHGNCTQ